MMQAGMPRAAGQEELVTGARTVVDELYELGGTVERHISLHRACGMLRATALGRPELTAHTVQAGVRKSRAWASSQQSAH